VTRPVVADAVDALAADGAVVSLRPVRAGDRPALEALFAGASPENLRMRFFSLPSRAAVAAEIDRLCRPADDRHLTMVATENGAVVGVAACERLGDTDHRAEFSAFVADGRHGRGIGTLLLEHLAARARRHGVTQLIGEILPDNAMMLRVARGLQARTSSRPGDGVVDAGVVTDAGYDDAQIAADARERTAERASLRALLTPSAVAVVGAGHTRGGVGHETLRALREYGFPGPVYAVNRSGRPIDGVAAYRRVRDLPGPVDLLVVAVPAEDVPGVLADGAAHGVRGAIVLSSGFGAGPDGRRRRAALARFARGHGMRLVGPNSLGIVNTDPRVRLHAGFAPHTPAAGGLAVASQSGAVGIALLDHARRAGCGVSSFVSLGDKADVSGNDLIAYWYEDPATRAVALYLESFGNPRRFARTVRALARRKPVLAVTCGRAPRTVDALFTQAGVVRTDTVGELLDAARMLTGQPLPAGPRLAVLGNAGGIGVLAADAAETHGLTVPAFGDALRADLRRIAPGAVATGNPVDLGADACPAVVAAAAEAVAASGEADALLLGVVGTRANVPAGILAALGPVVDRYAALPVAAVVVGSTDDAPALGTRRAPVYDLPERAATALGHAARYAAWRREPLGRRPDLPGVDQAGARARVDAALAGGGGPQPAEVTAALLSAYGIALRPGTTGTGEEMAAGIVHDPLFGSLVTLRLGGARTGLIADRVLRLVPMTDLDAGRMWRSLRYAPLLTGAPGHPGVDVAALEDLLLRLGRLAEDVPEVAELEIDPVLAGPDGVAAVGARLRLAPAGAEPDPALRRLGAVDPPERKKDQP
jgi:acyl-CoA synthetase (NDP forming)/GNAT superfamily N-acetyltransferase